MIETLKKNFRTLLFFALVGVVGGFFVGLYALDSYPAEIQAEILAEGLTPILLGLVTAIQSAGYGFVLGGIGIIVSEKIGLWKYERKIEKKPLCVTIAIAVILGLLIILLDLCYFSNISQAIADSYAAKPSIDNIIASILYGGVIEEVMLRLFLMSSVALVIHKVFERKNDTVSMWVIVLSNVIAAILFALGHLPATIMMIGSSPIIIARCFLLNGIAGLLLGWLYRKYGLRYAMIAHAGCHIVMKLIWVLAV